MIDLDAWWQEAHRVAKPRAAIVCTGSQPFTSRLVMSNAERFRYAIVWKKTMPTGYVHAKNKPLKLHEDILVFSEGVTLHEGQSENRMNYYPQMRKGKPYRKVQRNTNTGYLHQPTKSNIEWVGSVSKSEGERYPVSVVTFSNSNHNSLHPTQKPVALFEYLIRTYTQPGDLVLDPFVGSGTTALAARACGRAFLCGDSDAGYVDIARDRLRLPFEARHVSQETRWDDLPLFAGLEG